MSSAPRARSMSSSGACVSSSNDDMSRSATRGVVDAGRRQRRALQLVGELERAPRGGARGGLRLGCRGQAQEQPASEIVVIALVRLDDVAIEQRRLLVARAIAELDELAILHDRDRLARELPGGDARDRR